MDNFSVVHLNVRFLSDGSITIIICYDKCFSCHQSKIKIISHEQASNKLVFGIKAHIFSLHELTQNSKRKSGHFKLVCTRCVQSFIAKRVISSLVNLVNLRFKLLKYKENNKKMCDTFDRNFKNIPLYLMSYRYHSKDIILYYIMVSLL